MTKTDTLQLGKHQDLGYFLFAGSDYNKGAVITEYCGVVEKYKFK
jgi:hypothetical protein